MKISMMKNPIQEYAWGSTSAIPDLLGRDNPESRPQAELWMGAHPKAPSRVQHNGRWVSLTDLIAADPAGILGKKVAQDYQNRLPYLFKVLAAAKPLSIQAHPGLDQAREDRVARMRLPGRSIITRREHTNFAGAADVRIGRRGALCPPWHCMQRKGWE